MNVIMKVIMCMYCAEEAGAGPQGGGDGGAAPRGGAGSAAAPRGGTEAS